MTRYPNGQIPSSALVKIASGTDSNGYWEHQGSPHIIAIWRATQAYAQKKWGKTPKIRSGWNMYRPYEIQVAARKRACDSGNCLGAASPGYSSHGGTWINKGFTGGVWVDALAIDVDPNGLTWAQVWEAARANGFLCGAITPTLAGIDEPWHIIDLYPWDAVPASGPSTPFPLPLPQRKKATMILLKGPDSTSGTTSILAVAGPGVWDRYALGYEAALEAQFGPAIELPAASMQQKEILFKGAGVSAAEIDAALKDNFDAVIAAVKAIPAATGIAGPTAADIAKAIWDENAKRIQS